MSLPRKIRSGSLVVAVLAAGAAPAAVAHADPAAPHAAAAVKRVLFDNTKAETAGNADWIISTSQPDPKQQNANPATEASWTGAISAWGVALQRAGGYSLQTLPTGNTITYGSGGALDLSQFDEFVLPEPNIRLSTAEKTAVMKFVQAGGGLFLVSDHNASDRNNDGWDSPKIINDLLTSNGVDNTDPFGFSVDLANIASENPVASKTSTSPVLSGPFGKVTGSIMRNGTTFTLHPADDPAVQGLLWRPSSSQSGTTGAFFVTSTFGSGRVAIWGDSSAIDDGTGQSGNTLFNGWNDPAGTDAALALNATAWLAGTGGSTPPPTGVSVTNPGSQSTVTGSAVSLHISASSTAGGTLRYSATGLPPGLSIGATTGTITGTASTAGSYSATVTATDSTGPSGSTSFGWSVSSSGGGGCQSGELIGNPGFESGSAAPWTASTGVVNSDTTEAAHGGSWKAWLDGYGTARTDTVSQQVTIPAGCTTATFRFWLHIDSAASTTQVFDTLTADVLSSTGSQLRRLATYSNVDAATGYAQRTFDLGAYSGQTVTLKFTGTEDSTKQTSFVLDDASLTAS
ncbi:MAG: hypothetical protein QOI35_480 [Cryptosporangiaceae bacterium]|jgi:hypothetical protein|nr:hypothetical protein [Cryptosporangiaceae bacterium]MDQ1656964.1 hypothetical protein [Cryptosporangiaceae bacterium]